MGEAQDTGGAPVPPTDPWSSDKDYYRFDPERAKKLLAEAGAALVEEDHAEVFEGLPDPAVAEVALARALPVARREGPRT